jgi:hydroxypyruvate isomerase
MERRNFIKSGLASSALLAGTGKLWSRTQEPVRTAAQKFNLHYAPHLGMFKGLAGDDPVDQLKFMADQGFTAFEDNGMKGREVDVQKKMAAQMEKTGMKMGVFVAHTIPWNEPKLTSGNEEARAAFLKEMEESVEVAKRVNATWMTVVPGFQDLRLHIDFQTANIVETLKQACDILEPHGLTMVLEPLNFYNHPGMFLTEVPQAYLVCKAVGSPSCKILFDIYHQQITEGNIIPNIDRAWDEVAYFQIGDNPGRKEPTTGEINYLNIFKHIHDKGYDGILGMEHGNFSKGVEGEQAVIDAYRKVDNFM